MPRAADARIYRPVNQRRLQSGFTLVEVVVSAAIVVMLAAATAPSLMGFMDRQKAQTTANILTQLQQGIVNGTNQGFFNLVDSAAAVHNYPGSLHDLANPLVAAVATDHNSCGSIAARRYTTTDVTDWNNNGPFVTFPIAIVTGGANAVSTPLGFILDSIARDSVPATATGTKFLALRFVKMRRDDALSVDEIMDGVADSANGSIRWTTDATAGFVDLLFLIPINPTRC